MLLNFSTTILTSPILEVQGNCISQIITIELELGIVL